MVNITSAFKMKKKKSIIGKPFAFFEGGSGTWVVIERFTIAGCPYPAKKHTDRTKPMLSMQLLVTKVKLCETRR